MDLQSALQNLGLNEKEAAVYLALLEQGESTAYQVAKRSGLKKPTTYVILDQLIERGAVRKILKEKATAYTATDPVEIFVAARSRFEQAERSLPELRALARSDAKVVQTSYYEGLIGIKEMYKHLLQEAEGKTLLGFFAHTKDTPKGLIEYWKEFNTEVERRKIAVQGITPKDETTKPYLELAKKNKDRFELKGYPTSVYSSNISIEIYGDTTQITSHRYLKGILIRNPDIANTMRQIFELVWKKPSAT